MNLRTSSAPTVRVNGQSFSHQQSAHPIRVLIADDHPVVRKGLTFCLERRPYVQVVGEASDGQEALRKARELTPDVILMDFEMPLLNGLSVTETLRRECPEVRVLVLSTFSTPERVLRVLESGARGFMLKDASPEQLVQALDSVYAGESFFSPEVARTTLGHFVRGSSSNSGLEQLTCREREVLVAIAEGLSNKEIACRLNIGTRTVETHRERLMRKLKINSIAGLTKFAISQKLIPFPEASLAS